MSTLRHSMVAWIGFLLCSGATAASTAPYAHLVASETEVFLGQVFTVDVVVQAPAPPEPPPMDTIPDFHATILDAGRATSKTNTYHFRYAFRATREGDLTIPALSFRAQQETFSTSPLPIHARRPVLSDRMTLTTTLSKSSIRQGEPVLLTVTWDSTHPFSTLKGVDFHFPILNDERFQVLDPYEPDPEKSSQTTGLPVHGTRVLATRRDYSSGDQQHQSLSFSKILIPRQSGTLPIPSSTLLCAAETPPPGRPRRRSAFQYPPYFDNTFFDRNYSGDEYTRIYVESDPMQLVVSPLPTKDRPDSFNGMVGDFTLEAAARPAEVRVGEPITLTLTVTTPGFMENITLGPLRNQPQLARQFEIPLDRSLPERTRHAKIYSQTLRPLSATITEIPPILFTYFNPRAEGYVTAQSDPIPLHVSPAEAVAVFGTDGLPSRNRLRTGKEGIRHNYEAPDMLIRRRPPLLGWAHPFWVGSILLLPPLAFGGLSLVSLFTQKRHHIQRTAKAARAYAIYRRNASHLARRQGTKREIYGTLDEVLRAYLGDRLHLNPGALTFRDAEILLVRAGADSGAIGELRALFTRCEAYRFTAGFDEPADARSILHQATHIVRAIDRSAK